MLAQGCASEVHMNMDVTLHRLPELILYSSKFLVPFTVFMLFPQLTNRTVTFAYTGKIACLHTDLVNTAIRREIRKA